jgi:hypothetical protein
MKGVGALDGEFVRPQVNVPQDRGHWPGIRVEPGPWEMPSTLPDTDEPVAGFATGVRIATAKGWRRVESLQPGERIMTRDNGLVCLCALERRRALAGAVLMLRPGDVRGLEGEVTLGAGTGVLWTGGRVDEVLGTREGLLAARDLDAAPMGGEGFVTLFLPVLARQEVIFAEGMAVGSALPAGGRPARTMLSRNEAQRVLRH